LARGADPVDMAGADPVDMAGTDLVECMGMAGTELPGSMGMGGMQAKFTGTEGEDMEEVAIIINFMDTGILFHLAQ
jgi:hypothetical protein